MPDSIIYPEAFTTLVFYMAASSKGYILRVSDVSWILGLVSAIAGERKKSIVSFERRECPRLDCESVWKATNRDYIYALGLRKAFGGMSCDVGLMENALIYARSGDWTGVDADIIPIVDFEKLELKVDEWELAAIDFHVSNVLEQWRFELAIKDQGVEDEYLCAVMWKYSSGVSRKVGGEDSNRES
jgi:hypothetical protein